MSQNFGVSRLVLRSLWLLGLVLAAGCVDDDFGPFAPETPSPLTLPNDREQGPPSVIVLLDPKYNPSEVAREHGIVPKYVYTSVVTGFAGTMSELGRSGLRRDFRVTLIEDDDLVEVSGSQPNPTWGLDRIDQRPQLLDGVYRYERTGVGVTVYIADTGIRFTHSEFQGRASAGVDVLGGDGSDCHGHGTHVAGTVGGRMYGVAKAVALRSVRVLNCSGSGAISGVIAGLDWIAQYAARPAVVNLSLGGPANAALDEAVGRLIAAGIPVVVAAGNSNADACNASPARLPDAITVGASDNTDTRASFSNFGPCVDWFAPGAAVTSAIASSDNAVATWNGTSMAAPHTAGAAALILEAYPTASPATVAGTLASWSSKGVVKSANSTHNDLLFAAGDLGTGGGTGNSPPAASFSYACTGGTCQFTDQSTDSDGTVSGWLWDFGNGQTSTNLNPSHDFVWNGSYRVTLTVTDNSGAKGAVANTATVTGGSSPNNPPSADFRWECSDRVCQFVSTSTDLDGTIASYSWDFGDGRTGSGWLTSNYYAVAGVYSVVLTVIDNRGATDSQAYSITVGTPSGSPNAPPVAAFAFECAELTCTFTNQSTDSDGSIASWQWAFGDGGAATVPNPTHNFSSSGSYIVTLTVTDNRGATGVLSRSVTVTSVAPNLPPTADFAATCELLSCSFTDRSTDTDGSIVRWEWDFGDGKTLTSQSAPHSYPSAGTYTVKLSVTDNRGATTTKSQPVAVSGGAVNNPPAAAFSINCQGLSCTLDATPSTDNDGAVVSYAWEFGDGASGTGNKPIHSFKDPGSYDITLVVTDDDGATGAVTQTAEVEPLPPIALTAIPSRVKGQHRIDLSWLGANGNSVVIYRSGTVLVTTANDGKHTDATTNKGIATYLYRVCEVGTSVCSAEVKVEFR